MTDDRLYGDPELVAFYDLENGWGADTRFCLALAAGVGSVLDLGCGTGLLAAALGEGREVVGVDPAAAMLEVARGRPGGDAVAWVQADARRIRLGRRFDLVVMTGHAFQVFLTRQDRAAVLATIAAHLAPAGRFIFDSRNPACREWLEWTPERSLRSLDHPSLGRVRCWNDIAFDDRRSVATYGTHYVVEATGRRSSASSRIAFPPAAEIAAGIAAVGLVADRWYGDWEGAPLAPDAPEIIPFGGAA